MTELKQKDDSESAGTELDLCLRDGDDGSGSVGMEELHGAEGGAEEGGRVAGAFHGSGGTGGGVAGAVASLATKVMD